MDIVSNIASDTPNQPPLLSSKSDLRQSLLPKSDLLNPSLSKLDSHPSLSKSDSHPSSKSNQSPLSSFNQNQLISPYSPPEWVQSILTKAHLLHQQVISFTLSHL